MQNQKKIFFLGMTRGYTNHVKEIIYLFDLISEEYKYCIRIIGNIAIIKVNQ